MGDQADHMKLNLACGSNVLKDWVNIDIIEKPAVVKHDLLTGIPCKTETVGLIFCEHFIEHLTLKQAYRFIAECYRCLRHGGIIRISTPDLKKLVSEYRAGKIEEWQDVDWKPKTPCRMINEGFHNWGHQFLYDKDELISLFTQTGFVKVVKVVHKQSKIPQLCNLECRPYHGEIIIEAIK
jgi:predicted SAM-dependent methyltransferase